MLYKNAFVVIILSIPTTYNIGVPAHQSHNYTMLIMVGVLWVILSSLGMNTIKDENGKKHYPLWKSILYFMGGALVFSLIVVFGGPELFTGMM